MGMKKSTVLIGKLTRLLARLRGGGSAFPGLVVERYDPNFLSDVLRDLPHGVVVISGTNGKTTTTKIVTELLAASGFKVFTNRTGSNFTRGVISALLGEIRGFTFDADIAVLELDEAHAVQFVRQVQPDYVLLLNVLRDQLDRFGEIDKTAKLLEITAQSARRGVVLNRDDPLVVGISGALSACDISFFGYNPALSDKFPSDEELHKERVGLPVEAETTRHIADVELESFTQRQAVYRIGATSYGASLLLDGSHNILNAAAALALVRMVMGRDADTDHLIRALEKVQPAFGRGESIAINGVDLELILVKNPSGFRLALLSQLKHDADVMIAINDLYADGRDMSWLWDVDFTPLEQVKVVSGIRAYDMALRLKYDEVPFDLVQTDMATALDRFLSQSDRPKQIFCTYTAMLDIRKKLARVTEVEEAL